MLSPLLCDAFFTAVIMVAVPHIGEDEDILVVFVHLDEAYRRRRKRLHGGSVHEGVEGSGGHTFL